jgi:hypothetical protein
MTETFNDKKLSELISELRQKGYKVQEKPVLIIKKKDKQGFATKIEVDLSASFYAVCPNPRCGGKGRREFVVGTDGTINCEACKHPATLKMADVVDELRQRFAEENI